MISGTFNGVSLFAGYATDSNGTIDNSKESIFAIDGSRPTFDHTIDVYTSADGSAGAKVSIHKALAWSALTFNSANLNSTDGSHQLAYSAAYTGTNNSASADLDTVDESTEMVFTLAARDLDSTINLDNVSVNVFLSALENVAALRAQNGSTMSRLEFQEVNLSRQRSNMEAALGRITDVDMGAESTRMAKYNVLRQASAAMLAQANQSPEVVMMLIR
jgi:flagellin-like hook-associated protein FlgL